MLLLYFLLEQILESNLVLFDFRQLEGKNSFQEGSGECACMFIAAMINARQAVDFDTAVDCRMNDQEPRISALVNPRGGRSSSVF